MQYEYIIITSYNYRNMIKKRQSPTDSSMINIDILSTTSIPLNEMMITTSSLNNEDVSSDNDVDDMVDQKTSETIIFMNSNDTLLLK